MQGAKPKLIEQGRKLIIARAPRNKKLKTKWEGVSKKDLKQIMKRYKEVKIRRGIAFSPVFLISFIIFVIFRLLNVKLWNPFW